MAAHKISPWSIYEVQTFLGLVADERIQRELDGATRNEKVYQEVAQLMATHGYHRTYRQCREKLKKLKSDYRAIKDHNGRSGSRRKSWRWFDKMDSMYGHRPASNGRAGGLDTATSLLEAMVEDGKRKRSLFLQEQATALGEINLEDVRQQELNRAQRDQHLQMLLEEARQAREVEAAFRREENAQNAAFQQAFIGVLGQMVQALNNRHV
ncbi:zinc finger and SCAN domain-containing protein 29-like [Chaetodon trifascialis]|uniref:zinc finger and SCAN domain-containing protein 29-like n=1 Tax=Chaetodon trifascialis TaxID=109706 RepID=UPI003992B795